MTKKIPSGKKASEIIRNKLVKCGGTATVISHSRRSKYEIRISDDGKTFETNASIPCNEFKVFDIVSEFLLGQHDYSALKGNGRKSKYGEGECTDDTVVGRLARDYFKKSKGEWTFDPIMVINAVMTWAGITQFVPGKMQLTAKYIMYVNSEGDVEFNG